MQSYETTDWHKCYGESWTGLIVPDAFAHPAKFSRALIRHIYAHTVEEGWLAPGAVVVDPFGGVALGALHAMKHGLHWVGVELEEKFVGLGCANIEKWAADFEPHFQGWGSARLIQGDSRELAQVVGEAALCVSSPPYATKQLGGGGDTSMIGGGRRVLDAMKANYGQSPGQLATLPEGNLDACISSPPYSASLASDDPDKRGGLFRDPKRRRDKTLTAEYGMSAGQLGAMAEGGFDAAISSPPYESAIPRDGRGTSLKIRKQLEEKYNRKCSERSFPKGTYGCSDGQLGVESGETFWSASHIIVSQVYQILKHGGVAIWITKSFVRKGKRVNFPGQWRQLCESVGFETLHEHRGWLVEDRGAQYDLMGNLHERKVQRKSFFRRLQEQKGAPRIDWETIWCMRKPA